MLFSVWVHAILYTYTSCIIEGCSQSLWDSHKKTDNTPTQTHTNHSSGSMGGDVAGVNDMLPMRHCNLHSCPWLFINGTQPDRHSWLDWNQQLCCADSDKFLFLKLPPPTISVLTAFNIWSDQITTHVKSALLKMILSNTFYHPSEKKRGTGGTLGMQLNIMDSNLALVNH